MFLGSLLLHKSLHLNLDCQVLRHISWQSGDSEQINIASKPSRFWDGCLGLAVWLPWDRIPFWRSARPSELSSCMLAQTWDRLRIFSGPGRCKIAGFFYWCSAGRDCSEKISLCSFLKRLRSFDQRREENFGRFVCSFRGLASCLWVSAICLKELNCFSSLLTVAALASFVTTPDLNQGYPTSPQALILFYFYSASTRCFFGCWFYQLFFTRQLWESQTVSGWISSWFWTQ